MADGGRALQWTGYGSLASALDFGSSALRQPCPPSQPSHAPFIAYSPDLIPQTPPSTWASPYSTPSSPETASPMTPPASFALYSPTAFHSVPLNYSKPSHYSNYSPASPLLRAATPSSPSIIIGSPYAPMSPRMLSTPSSPPPELAPVPINRPGPLIPQRTYSAPNTAGFQPKEIEFRLQGRPLGIPMRLLQDPGAMDLPIEGANTVPFSQSVASTITLRIWWPGYVQYSRRMTMRKATGLLMCSELAMAISAVFKEFIEDAREDPKDRGQSHWRVGRGRITVNDLVLLRVFQVSQGSWQAEVRLENDR